MCSLTLQGNVFLLYGVVKAKVKITCHLSKHLFLKKKKKNLEYINIRNERVTVFGPALSSTLIIVIQSRLVWNLTFRVQTQEPGL